MKKKMFRRAKTIKIIFCGFALVGIFSVSVFAQKPKPKTPAAKPAQTKVRTEKPAETIDPDLPKVMQIDGIALEKLLKPNGKPVLINFWATWCGPCVEEFPELVKINVDYKDKLDVKAISLDDLAEINAGVPKFLAKMKSEIPAYLLKTPDEDTAIQNVDKSWQGALPFTLLINTDGTISYKRQGIFNPKILREEIEKTFINQPRITELPKPAFNSNQTYEKGITDAKSDAAKKIFVIHKYGLTPGAIPDAQRTQLQKKYNIKLIEHGCLVSQNEIEYFKGYNEVSMTEIKRRFNLSF